MKEKIKFQDLIARCSEYLKGIITQEELSEATKALKIRFYIPMEEKVEIIQDILYNSYFTMEPIELKITDIEKAKVLKGFLKYFENIEYDEEARTLLDNNDSYSFEIVEQVLNMGSPELVKFFEKDYKKLSSMIDSIIFQGDMHALLGLLEGFDVEELKKENKKLRKNFNDITKTEKGQQAISDLLEIARFNDPMTKKLIEMDALKEVEKKYKK